MRVLFLHNRLSLEGEPLGLMQLISIVRQAGHEVELTFLHDAYLEACRIFKPDLLAASVMSSDSGVFTSALKKIKQAFPSLPVLMGGPHATFMPNSIESLEVDALCVGEGDEAILDVLEHIGNRQPLEGCAIPNIISRTSQNPPRPLVHNLDVLPFLDRDLIYSKSDTLKHFPLRTFAASRGCPFACTYCFNHSYNALYKGLGPIVRRRSVENLIQEIEIVTKSYPTKFIKFADDAFIHRIDDWFIHFSKEYKSKINIPFYCLLRADVVSEDMVYLLKSAGCTSVCMSIESGSEPLRKNILNRNVSNDKIIKSFDMFNSAGIKIYTNNLLGLPGSSLQDDFDTLKLNIRCKPGIGHFTIMTPFPGTKIYTYCEEKNLLPESLKRGKIPSSVGAKSTLTCFSEKEKRIQRNIAMLGPLVVKFPFLFSIAVKYLFKVPENTFYKFIYFLTKNYLFKKHIVPVRFPIKLLVKVSILQIKETVIQNK